MCKKIKIKQKTNVTKTITKETGANCKLNVEEKKKILNCTFVHCSP